MKIDLHCHTKQTKKDEQKTRTIPDNNSSYEEFIQSRIDKNIGVLAITNHNHFDDDQFEKIINIAGDKILVLPGVEIDVIDSKNERHNCNLIVSKSKRHLLNNFLLPYKGQENTFKVSLSKFIELAKDWKPILLIDSREKDKDFPIEDIELIEKSSNEFNFFYVFEASNAKSASIATNHNLKFIVGSDSHFWNNFNSEKLPEVDNEITGFEGLVTFLKSNYYYGLNITKEFSMNILPEDIKDTNGPWEKEIKFDLKSGVNIIVGPKASGKSVLLLSIKRELEKKHSTEIQYYGEENNWNAFENEKIDLLLKEKLNIEEQFTDLKDSLEMATKISFSNINSNWKTLNKWVSSDKHKVYNKLEELVDGPHSWSETLEKELNEKIEDFSKDLSTIDSINPILEKYEFDINDKNHAKTSLLKIKNSIKQQMIQIYINNIKNKIINKTKNLLKNEISKKTNNISKPSKLGLFDYWLIRKNLDDSIERIIKIKEKNSQPIFVGDLIDGRGKQKEIYINCLSFLYTKEYKNKYGSTIKNNNKKATLNFVKELKNIQDNILKNEILKKIIDIKKLLDNKELTADKIIGYIIFYTKDKLNQEPPSSGEQNFLLLSNILNNTDSNYFILDEPEKSLDNKIVNDYIVEKIHQLQAQNKYIILTTHSANIAINTYPKLIIYREIHSDGKFTWIGDSSSGVLTSEESNNKMCWRTTSLSLLEGGERALKARKDYYFNE